MYTGYCFQMYREKMCSWFLFLHRISTWGHHVIRMVYRESSRIQGSEKLLGQAGKPEGSWLFYKGSMT